MLTAGLVASLFYRSVIAFLLLAPAGAVFLPLRMRAVLAARRREALSRQFRDGILAVASALNAGYAIENAWREAAAEMAVIYGEQGEITREFRGISRKLAMSQTTEDAVRNLAERSGIPEIRQFAEVFAAAKRTSGNLAPILSETADLLSRKLRLREEIRTMVTAKRLEQNIMNGMPLMILLYINLGNPGFTDPLYRTLAGRLIMTLCLAVYGFAVWLGQRILAVEV